MIIPPTKVYKPAITFLLTFYLLYHSEKILSTKRSYAMHLWNTDAEKAFNCSLDKNPLQQQRVLII